MSQDLHHLPAGRRPTRAAPALTALVSAVALTAAPPAQAQQPTLQFDRECYTEMQGIGFAGAGYTAGGVVDLLFARPGQPRGGDATVADASGAIAGFTGVEDADQLLDRDEQRETIFVTANDRTRIEAGQPPPESWFGAAQFTFTRWQGYSPGRYVPGKRARVEIFGWTFATGRRAWLLFRKGSRTVASVSLGRLDDDCGDRRAAVRVPRRLDAGRYRVVLTTDRRLRGPYTWRWARVTAGASTAAAATGAGAMRRVGVR